MIAVLPQPGQRHRNANEVAAWPQSQLVSGCFIVGTLYQILAVPKIPHPDFWDSAKADWVGLGYSRMSHPHSPQPRRPNLQLVT
jgi:hypothetical protein